MTDKHTLEPLFADGAYVHIGVKKGRYALDRQPTLHIATVHITDPTNKRATQEAYARLFAAAPKVLKALGERGIK